MRYYTKPECEEWLHSRQRQAPGETPGLVRERVNYPAEPHRFVAMARWMGATLPERMPVLLWITEWGIWPSSENLHLYHRLRQSYHDYRFLEEAPGHFFLGHESEDLVSFLQLAMLNGWGGYLLTQADYINAFFSHDEFIDFYAANHELLAAVRKLSAGS